jgi:hypothetical protein
MIQIKSSKEDETPRKPIRGDYSSLVDFAHDMAVYYEEVRFCALRDIRKIDGAARKSGAITSNKIVTRETERERISAHEKAQNNPLLRDILKKMEIKW